MPELWAQGGCSGCCEMQAFPQDPGMALGCHQASQMKLRVSSAIVLIFHPYQEDCVQPRAGRMKSGCCDLPSLGFKWKIQVWALLALLK